MLAPRLLLNRALAAGTALLLVTVLASCSSGGDEPASTGNASTPKAAKPSATAVETKSTDVVALAMNADGMLGGNATVTDYPAGEPGVLSVVETAPLEDNDSLGSVLPIVFRNNTDATVSHVDIAGTARGADGALAATGSSQGTVPAQVPSGGLGLAYIYFEGEPPAGDATYEFTFETIEADTSSYNTASLKVTEAALSGSAIVGTAVNGNDATVTGPYSVAVYCFDDAGKLLSYTSAFADQDDDQASGAQVSFSADLYDAPCPTFRVGVAGYFA